MRKLKPTTPGSRGAILVSYKDILSNVKPLKKLTRGRKRYAGRSGSGRISVRHKGGGHKRRFREIDFMYDKKDVPARIETIEYDPNRSGFIALASYLDGEKRYVLANSSLKTGNEFVVSEHAPIKPGNRTLLKNIPVGTSVYCIEMQPGGGARLARSAGNFAQIVAHADGYAHLKMSSGEIRKITENSWASVGEVSNSEHKLRNLGKAGRSRWLGIRPTVRGSAMNPVDHPYGGGEGRSGRGLRYAKSLWGKHTGGVKTRRSKKYSNVFIVKRRKNARERRR